MSSNQRSQRILSPANSIKSSQSLYHSIKIKIPKHQKLHSFFANSPHKMIVQGKPKQIMESERKMNKAVSLRSIASSSLAKKIQQNSQHHRDMEIENNEHEKNFKDQSQTRSGLTIQQQYGLGPVKNVQKNVFLSPKTPKCIKSMSGSKKVLFPIKATNKHQKPGKAKEKDKKNANSMEYTFGVQGFNFNFNSIK